MGPRAWLAGGRGRCARRPATLAQGVDGRQTVTDVTVEGRRETGGIRGTTSGLAFQGRLPIISANRSAYVRELFVAGSPVHVAWLHADRVDDRGGGHWGA